MEKGRGRDKEKGREGQGRKEVKKGRENKW